MADTTSTVSSATTVADLIAAGGRALPAERVGDAQALISWILNTMCPNKVRERASNLRQALSVDALAKPAGPAVVHSSPAELREFAQNVITDINSGIAYTADGDRRAHRALLRRTCTLRASLRRNRVHGSQPRKHR